ncbi:MAG: arginine deiminase [Prolixibacteraceae bacterium]|jgi:arginine deiminase|nr:arginine deiminase [Prolixibacteraceae bacterium]MBT6006090.1 arginine deiminase [Prolixibacteraceae bacterium]MBT6999837.1 arginine deiminase [Prolixibacteraceae bacterium]MBT7394290.1 arginine deiminase [Prolixibacteraceae bacterium]
MKTCINSEIGKLEGVIIHTPGPEVENMTPENAERALYSDILNLSIASKEYAQMAGVLKTLTPVFEVKKLLTEIIGDKNTKLGLLKEICRVEGICGMENDLLRNSASDLANLLVEGVVLEKNNLTNYLANERFLLRPLHNLFFTRDSAMGMNNNMLIGKMANPVRERETLIMDSIFNKHPAFETTTINPSKPVSKIERTLQSTIEGGDFQVARNDVFVIGTGVRTSTQGIDFIIENLKQIKTGPHHIIVQELPSNPESFIHLDMVFTFLDTDSCMVYEPVIYKMNRFRTIHIHIENKKVKKIEEQPNIPTALRKLGIDLKPIFCGGENDPWIQEREQWHSGANFFAFEPGKVIGYQRNIYTVEELNKNGFEVLKATDVIERKVSPNDFKKCVVTIAGSELSRGGGGARCMTMPVRRAEVK